MSDPVGTVEPEQIALFVECYHRNGGDAVDACVKARIVNPFYSIDVIAARLMERPEVTAALATMKKLKPSVSSVEITRDSIMSDMQTIYERALMGGDNKAAIAAKRLQAEIGKMLGQDININVKHIASEMSDADLMKIVAGKAIDVDYEDVTPAKTGIAAISRG